MPKSTVTVDSGNNFAYPTKLDIVNANGLVTQDNIKELRLPKLTFECTTDDNTNTKYKVELKVSILSVDGDLIPQVELGIPQRVANEE